MSLTFPWALSSSPAMARRTRGRRACPFDFDKAGVELKILVQFWVLIFHLSTCIADQSQPVVSSFRFVDSNEEYWS